MKKSEAIKQLTAYIERKTDLNGRITSLEIIDFLQGLGMVPSITTEENTPGRYVKSTRFGKWEKEDEKES